MAGERTRNRTRSSGTAVSDGSTAVAGSEDEQAPPEAPPEPTVEQTAATLDATENPADPTDPGGANAAGAPAETEQPQGSTRTAQDIAAKRRRQLDRTPGAHPAGAAPPAVDGVVPDAIVIDRAIIDGITVEGSPVRPVGGVWNDMPVVLENIPNAAGGRTVDPNYVISEFDAIESTIPPRALTPVSRRRWNVGMLVRRDVYEAALADYRARVEAGTYQQGVPARLPAHVTHIPPDVVATGPDGTRSGRTFEPVYGEAGQAAPARPVQTVELPADTPAGVLPDGTVPAAPAPDPISPTSETTPETTPPAAPPVPPA